MKLICSLLMMMTVSILPHQANAQLWKRIKQEVKNRAENHVVNNAGDATDKTIDKTETAAGNVIFNNHSNKNTRKQTKTPPPVQTTPTPSASVVSPTPAFSIKSTSDVAATPPAPTKANYKSYDFVPGDKIIFETDFKRQQNAELPAHLGTLGGNIEVETYKGEKVLHLDKGDNVCFVPQMDSVNYLPSQFTVEFDFLYNAKDPQANNQIEVNFYTADKDNSDMTSNPGDYQFLIYEAYDIYFGKTIQDRKLPQALANSLKLPETWHHLAIYVHNNIGKVYIDQYRVGASDMMMKRITKLAVKTNGKMDYLIKNLRIAAGGTDAYHKIMTEGKLVTHGIHFATGSANILPESMGTINEVYNILQNHRDLKFEIDGYTDNIGNAENNLNLSQERADAVKAQLVNMGVDASRLATSGFGEQNPIDSNATPEGKANNRRVEFVKN